MKIIGHRGAKGLAPENTLASFAKAIECGVDMIETDVQQTSDGVLVLFHNKKIPINGTSQHFRNASHETVLLHNQDVPTLAEAIEFIHKRTRMMVEVKPGTPTAPVIEVIQGYLERGWKPEDFMFNSESYTILRELQLAFPEIERIIQGKWSGVRVQYLARKLDTPYILLDQRYVWWGYVRSVSKKYKLVTYTYPWSKNERFNHFKAEKWARHGLWGAVTDYPDTFNKKT